MSTWVLDDNTPSTRIETMPAELNITAYQGDDFRLLFQLRTSEIVSGSPVPADLTGSVGLMQLRLADDRDSPLVLEIPFVDDNLATGWVEFYGPHALMTTIDPEIYFYDAQLTSDAGVVRTFIQGTFTVVAEVST